MHFSFLHTPLFTPTLMFLQKKYALQHYFLYFTISFYHSSVPIGWIPFLPTWFSHLLSTYLHTYYYRLWVKSARVFTMPDLRRQIFESGKTVSRKAASREASRINSRVSSTKTSRQSSRNASRHPSDDEDAGFLTDDTAMRWAQIPTAFT